MSTRDMTLLADSFGFIQVRVILVPETPTYEEFQECLKQARFRVSEEAEKVIMCLAHENLKGSLQNLRVEAEDYETSVVAEVFIDDKRNDVAQGILCENKRFKEMFAS